MFSTPTLVRRIGLGAVAVAMIATLSACGSKSLVENFTAKITASDFQSSGSVNGTMSITASAQKYDATFTGSMKIKGKDSQMSMSTSLAGQTSTTDTVTIGDTKYDKGTDGKWTKTARGASDTSITDILSYGVIDKGVEAHNGQQLHRLETSKPVDPKTLFGTTTVTTNANLSLVFWAKDDGSPAGMTVTGSWTQDMSGTSANATISLDFNFDQLSGVTIEAPQM